MPINFTIHSATLEDFDTLLRLNHELFEYEYIEGFSETYNREWTFSDDGKKYFKSMIEDENKHAWIAFNDKKIQVGFIIGAIHDLPFRSPSRVAEIEMIYLEPSYRCSGIGRTLVEEFKNWAIEKEAGILRVGALAPNKHARDFYEKGGFAEAEIMYEMTI